MGPTIRLMGDELKISIDGGNIWKELVPIKDYSVELEEEINMNKVLELYKEREEKRIRDKYNKLKEDMYNDVPVVK